jgi:C_GCAxxG_C_C family probable redox protein
MEKQEIISQALSFFDEGYACSQSILLAFGRHFDLDERTAKRIASTFGGGMGRLRQTCGAVTGGFMVLGLAFGNENPKDMETKLDAYRKVRAMDQHVREIYGTTVCKELLQKHVSQEQVIERKHHKIICRHIIEDVAGHLYDMIEQNSN